MDPVRAPDGRGCRLTEAEIADLALLDQAFHGADRVLDRHRRVDAMLVVEVDHVDAEALEARVAGLDDVVGRPLTVARPSGVRT